MRITLTKSGNSLAVRIPKTVVDEIDLAEGRQVDLRVARGKIVIDPVRSREWTIEGLVSEITPENLHRELPSGEPRGVEAW